MTDFRRTLFNVEVYMPTRDMLARHRSAMPCHPRRQWFEVHVAFLSDEYSVVGHRLAADSEEARAWALSLARRGRRTVISNSNVLGGKALFKRREGKHHVSQRTR